MSVKGSSQVKDQSSHTISVRCTPHRIWQSYSASRFLVYVHTQMLHPTPSPSHLRNPTLRAVFDRAAKNRSRLCNTAISMSIRSMFLARTQIAQNRFAVVIILSLMDRGTTLRQLAHLETTSVTRLLAWKRVCTLPSDNSLPMPASRFSLATSRTTLSGTRPSRRTR